MIGAPDVLVSKDSARTQRTLQLAVGKENIGTSANKSLAAIRTQEKALSESMQQVPRIGLHVADRLSPSSGKLLIVEGNIGVGKTTLTQKIARELNYKLFLEPATENPFLGKESSPYELCMLCIMLMFSSHFLPAHPLYPHTPQPG